MNTHSAVCQNVINVKRDGEGGLGIDKKCLENSAATFAHTYERQIEAFLMEKNVSWQWNLYVQLIGNLMEKIKYIIIYYTKGRGNIEAI